MSVLTTKIMHRCIKQLLQQNSEESMECLCKLFETIGPDIERFGEVNMYFCASALLPVLTLTIKYAHIFCNEKYG